LEDNGREKERVVQKNTIKDQKTQLVCAIRNANHYTFLQGKKAKGTATQGMELGGGNGAWK